MAKKHPSWCLECWLRGCSDLRAACLVSGGRGGRRPRPPRERVAVGGGKGVGAGAGAALKGQTRFFFVPPFVFLLCFPWALL